MSNVIVLGESVVTESGEVYEHALPELRWVHRVATNSTGMLLQQRWRIISDGKPPRHEWRDVPTVEEG